MRRGAAFTRLLPSSQVLPHQRRHFTISRVIAQSWLALLTYVPASKTAAAAAATTTTGASAGFYFGLTDPTMIMLGCGVIARLSTLPLSLYGDRCLARLANAMPELIAAYDSYTSIADHPKSIGWERKVARSKLKRDRRRIFGLHGTGSMRTFIPQMIAGGTTLYFMLIPAAIANTAAVVVQPLIPIGAPFVGAQLTGTMTALSATVATLDGGFALAAALSVWNGLSVVERRLGFNDTLDTRLLMIRRYGPVGCAAAVGVAAYLAPIALASAATVTVGSVSPVAIIPAYVAPFWVGVAVTSTIQHAVMKSAPLRSMLDVPKYPLTHGTYGNSTTGSIIDRSGDDASSQIDEYERNEQWRKHKMLLDFECNMKIYKMLKWMRLETPEDDFERQRERLAFRLAAKRKEDGSLEENEDKAISQEMHRPPQAKGKQ